MKVIRGAVDEMWSIIGQMTSSVFRHGLPLTDKIAARTALTNFVLHIHPVRVRRSWIRMSYTLCLGGLTFFLFIVLTVTGLYLMFYYVPSINHAYQDMRDLQFVVTFGGLIRNMHRWAAHAMVITVWLHMARVFLTGAYKKPREFNWGIGTLLLLITLLLSFTGYLLPWDQLSIWAVTVGTNMARATPGLGHEGPFGELLGVNARYDARSFLTAGRLVGSATLMRFYVLHCVFIPVIVMVVVTVWSITIDAPLEEPANPNKTPNPSKAPWYFLGLQEMLVYFDPWMAGVVLPSLIIVGLMVVPYIDTNPKGNGYYTFSERKFAIATFLVGFLGMWVGMITIGVFFRGPGWNLFMPWDYWDPHKVVPLVNIDLPYIVGIRSEMGAMLFGAICILGWLVAIP